MQTPTSINPKRGGPRPGAGRPVGYRSPSTIRKLAFKVLEQILLDESSPAVARAMAACKLVEEIKA
jgi:hypothetical protein